CDASLASCLEAFERICDWHGYDVISANERRHHDELREVSNVRITSEAVVRCKQAEPLLGSPPSPPPAPPTPPPPTRGPSVPAPGPIPAPAAADGCVPADPDSQDDPCRKGPGR